MNAEESGRRRIGRFAAFNVVAGAMVGVGIFIYPPVVAALLPAPMAFFGVWVLAGLVAFAGAVAYAELGALMPRAGGDYVFIAEAFGPSAAFAAGWVIFAGSFCGSIATLAVAVCQYQLPVLLGTDLSVTWVAIGPLHVSGTQVLAVLLIVLVTAVNAAGARLVAAVQIATTAIPVALLLLAATAALASDATAPDVTLAPEVARRIADGSTLDDFVQAYMAVYFAYAGWNAVTYVAGEIRDPGRVIPFSLLTGTTATAALYLVLVGAFIHVFGPVLSTIPEAGSALAAHVFGDGSRLAMVALIAVAITGTLNATILGGARVAWAMANDGALWRPAADLTTTSRVPVVALCVQALLAVLIVLSGTFDAIYTLTSLAMVVAATLTVLALFRLRRTRPDEARPYRASGYPWLPGLFVAASCLVIIVMVRRALTGAEGGWYPLLGLGLLVVAWAGHHLLRGDPGSETA